MIGADHEAGAHHLRCFAGLVGLGEAKGCPVGTEDPRCGEELLQISLLAKHGPKGQSVGCAELEGSIGVEEFASGGNDFLVGKDGG